MEVTVLHHVALLDGAFIVLAVVADVGFLVFLFDARPESVELGVGLAKSVLAIELKERKVNKRPGLIVSHGMTRHRMSHALERVPDGLLLSNGSVSHSARELLEL